MSVTGLQLLRQAGDRLGAVTAACIRVDGYFGAVPVLELDAWLERMSFFDDPLDPGWTGHAAPAGHDYRFQIWTRSRIWFVGERDGIARLEWMPLTPEEWTVAASRFQERLVNISTGRPWRFGREIGE